MNGVQRLAIVCPSLLGQLTVPARRHPLLVAAREEPAPSHQVYG